MKWGKEEKVHEQVRKCVNSVSKNCKLKQNEIPDSPCKVAKIAFLHVVIYCFGKGVGKQTLFFS